MVQLHDPFPLLLPCVPCPVIYTGGEKLTPLGNSGRIFGVSLESGKVDSQLNRRNSKCARRNRAMKRTTRVLYLAMILQVAVSLHGHFAPDRIGPSPRKPAPREQENR